MNTKIKGRAAILDWKNTNFGWRGFFQGYATAEKDAINRSRDRVGYIVENLRVMIRDKKTDADLLNFLDKIKVKHA